MVIVIFAAVAPSAAESPGARSAPARTIEEFPPKTFLESIAVAPDGSLRVTSYLDGKVYSIDQAGHAKLFAQIDGTIAGLAYECPRGDLLVGGWLGGKRPAIFRVPADGKPRLLLELPGAVFPNGFSNLAGDRFLVADSAKGVIWEVDVGKRRARIWLKHALLAPIEAVDAKNPVPGVNGLKIFGGALYASNGQRQLVLRIPIAADGSPGEPKPLVKDLFLDDFAFDVKGNIYGATHTRNSVVRVASDGSVTTLGGLAQGLAGSTAVAFGRGADSRALFVTTNGGMSAPPAGGIQPGRVVRLEVGETGAPVCF